MGKTFVGENDAEKLISKVIGDIDMSQLESEILKRRCVCLNTVIGSCRYTEF